MENTFTTPQLRNPHHLLVRALDFTTGRDSALDIGAGSCVDSAFLVSQEFKNVDAVDIKTPTNIPDGVSFTESAISDFTFGSYDVIHARYVLHLLKPGIFDVIKSSLKDGGVFVGNVFAEDSTFPEGAKTFTAIEIMDLLKPLNLVSISDTVSQHADMSGVVRDWHIYEFIAKK